MIYLQLFYTFFKIGLFGFGGGYAMLSMIQGEVVTRYDWVSTQEFTDIVAISHSRSHRYQCRYLCWLYGYRQYLGICHRHLCGSVAVIYPDVDHQ